MWLVKSWGVCVEGGVKNAIAGLSVATLSLRCPGRESLYAPLATDKADTEIHP